MLQMENRNPNQLKPLDVAIVGGGLAGLTAATILARAGKTVALYEKAQHIGGRAITQAYGEFYFNLGAHALYPIGTKILRQLGIEFKAGQPKVNGKGVYQGKLYDLPGSPTSIISNRFLKFRGKLELVSFFTKLHKIDPETIANLSFKSWLESTFREPEMRLLVAALMRVSSYANASEQQSASIFVRQMQMTLKESVLYLDGGWQTLVDGLQQAALQAGAKIITATKVEAIEHNGAVQAVHLADGRRQPATNVIIAATPTISSQLVDNGKHEVLQAWAENAILIKAASLDIGLRRLPQPHQTFALGLDRPLYLSVHSDAARLGPEGGAVIHLLKYLSHAEPDQPKATEQELENLLDLVQPGWRAEMVERRFLPNITVSHGLVTAAEGGLSGRPGPQVPGLDNLYVAGDWVGSEGILTDASLTSAVRAAQLIISGQSSTVSQVASSLSH